MTTDDGVAAGNDGAGEPQVSAAAPELSPQATEVINRNTVVSLALAKGFIAFLPVYDAGIDFILYREIDQKTFYVQLKSRWTINEKYRGRSISVAFPDNGQWYLVEHDDMLAWGETVGLTGTKSWTVGKAYSFPKLTKAMTSYFKDHKFELIAEVAGRASRVPPNDH